MQIDLFNPISEKVEPKGLKKICSKCKLEKDLKDFYKKPNQCKDCIKEYYKTNKENKIAYSTEYRKKNIKKVNEQIKNRKKTDINFKLLTNIRIRINQVIKGNYKSGSTLELLGCNIETVKTHLEKQFKTGMSWENHGNNGWHIDHIIPCASFDLSKPEEQKKCFHYTNLQPLWKKDNLTKHAKNPLFNELIFLREKIRLLENSKSF